MATYTNLFLRSLMTNPSHQHVSGKHHCLDPSRGPFQSISTLDMPHLLYLEQTRVWFLFLSQKQWALISMVAIQHSQDFLGGPVVKTLPSSAGSTGGFPGGTSGKDAVCQCRRHKRPSSFHESGRSLGGGHGNPLQYSCLEHPGGQRSLADCIWLNRIRHD